jgi:hypothetical protein
MVSFYSSIMFIGIILIIISLIWIFLDRSRAHDTELRLDEKKAELVRIISDAEMMVEELNKFSDYVATQIEEKNKEISDKFKEFENRIYSMELEVSSRCDNIKANIENIGNNLVDVNHMGEKASNSDVVQEISEEQQVPKTRGRKGNSQKKVKDNVISINSKHNEVIMLAQEGLNETEIARKLNMGKGEIQLILGVNR